mmetsp:Transcript_26499/g.77057  ORF Transcript_26499/g.77057 Transcript_26499/m.77057 type:complete len:249 (-) Transcript_26499:282-1028(-)
MPVVRYFPLGSDTRAESRSFHAGEKRTAEAMCLSTPRTSIETTPAGGKRRSMRCIGASMQELVSIGSTATGSESARTAPLPCGSTWAMLRDVKRYEFEKWTVVREPRCCTISSPPHQKWLKRTTSSKVSIFVPTPRTEGPFPTMTTRLPSFGLFGRTFRRAATRSTVGCALACWVREAQRPRRRVPAERGEGWSAEREAGGTGEAHMRVCRRRRGSRARRGGARARAAVACRSRSARTASGRGAARAG